MRLLSILIYLFMLLFRCCCTCIKCGPKNVDLNALNDEEYQAWAANTSKWRNRMLFFFILFLLFSVIAVHVIFYGNQQLTSGVHSTEDALNSLSDIFVGIANTVSDIGVQTSAISTELSASQCVQTLQTYDPNFVSPSTYLSPINTYTDSISSMISNIPNTLHDANDSLSYYGIYVKNLVVYIFYAIIMTVSVLFALGGGLHSFYLTKFAMILAIVIVIALTIICSIEMVVVVSVFLVSICHTFV